MQIAGYAVTTLAVVLAFFLMLSGELPRWCKGGVDPVRHVPLQPVGSYPIVAVSGRPMVFIGDSNTVGTRIGGRGRAYPALLKLPKHAKAVIDNRAVGGALVPLAGQVGEPLQNAQIAVVMLGTNDAATRRYLGRRTPVVLDLFRKRLASVVRKAMIDGAKLLILAAPPAGSVAMDERIAPYRRAARDVAIQTGAHFHDLVSALDGTQRECGAFLLYDGLHISELGQSVIANWLETLFVTN